MYAGVLVMAALVQAAWLTRIQISGVALDPLLPLTVAVGVFRGAEQGAVVGLAAGLLQDLLSGGPLGVNGLSKLVVGFASGLFERSIYIENPLLPAVAAFAGSLLAETLLTIIGVVTGVGPFVWSVAIPQVLVQAALNSAIAPVVFRGVRSIEERIEKRYGES